MEIFDPKLLKQLAKYATFAAVPAVVMGCSPAPTTEVTSAPPKAEPTPVARVAQSVIKVGDGYSYITRVNDQTLFIGTQVSGFDGFGMAQGISYLREHGCVIGAMSAVSGGNLVDSPNCLTNELK